VVSDKKINDGYRLRKNAQDNGKKPFITNDLLWLADYRSQITEYQMK